MQAEQGLRSRKVFIVGGGVEGGSRPSRFPRPGCAALLLLSLLPAALCMSRSCSIQPFCMMHMQDACTC